MCAAEPVRSFFLDQNVPYAVKRFLREMREDWDVWHVRDLGLEGQPDDVLFRWAQEHSAVIVTFDEDFADSRLYALGTHHGVIRLRIWPTTTEEACSALQRLLQSVGDSRWIGALTIIDNRKIRIRQPG
ncbi:MAG TPA: DUF5615 family PIN-like protein [bacterium]|nr:DUF5615 family PIN-like protein [bacterium]HQO36996.1 DUF5615 family PIN-like protein [bacterium]HQP99012.1 DUF5615 family PIN-like protein [bacterium]